MSTVTSTTVELVPRRRRPEGTSGRQARVVNVTVRPDPRALLSVEDAAERLDIGCTMLCELIAAGEIATITVGRLRKVPLSAITEFVERRRQCQ
ncbi:MAG: helix-turn-helix domain-containing protein [Actinomycetales bacterium]|nr:helix-turn-helix domain-containing protein [Actinomycetales bacterium]